MINKATSKGDQQQDQGEQQDQSQDGEQQQEGQEEGDSPDQTDGDGEPTDEQDGQPGDQPGAGQPDPMQQLSDALQEGRLTEEEAQQILAAIAGSSETLQERLNAIFAVPGAASDTRLVTGKTNNEHTNKATLTVWTLSKLGIAIAAVAGLIALTMPAYAQTGEPPIMATVDRTQLSTDDTLLLTIKITTNGTQYVQPVIPGMDDFTVVGQKLLDPIDNHKRRRLVSRDLRAALAATPGRDADDSNCQHHTGWCHARHSSHYD